MIIKHPKGEHPPIRHGPWWRRRICSHPGYLVHLMEPNREVLWTHKRLHEQTRQEWPRKRKPRPSPKRL
jgi:hypothetical protein